MKKNGMVPLLLLAVLLTGCDAANAHSYAGPLPERLSKQSVWQAERFGDRGGALLFFDAMEDELVRFALYYYEYFPVADTDCSALADGQMYGMLRISGNTLTGNVQLYEMPFELTFNMKENTLSLDYANAEDDSVTVTDGRVQFSYDHFSDVFLPTKFTYISGEAVGQAAADFPLCRSRELFELYWLSETPPTPTPTPDLSDYYNVTLHGSSIQTYDITVPVPYGRLTSFRELIGLLGEPQNLSMGIGSIFNWFEMQYADKTLRGWAEGDRCSLVTFDSADPSCIPECQEIALEDTLDDVISAFLPDLTVTEINLRAPTNGNAYVFSQTEGMYDYCIITFDSGRLTAFSYSNGGVITYYFDNEDRVEQISYFIEW